MARSDEFDEDEIADEARDASDDPEAPDPSDVDDDDDDETEPCPYCGKPVYEKADWCPHCRSYLSREDAPRPPRPLWIWAAVVLALLGMLWWVF